MFNTLVDVNESNHKIKNMQEHFSRISSKYHQLRITDLEPITFMVQKLNGLSHIKAADIGCGVGRYDKILCQDLGEKLTLTCIDANAGMLEALHINLTEEGIQNFTSIQASAEDLPLPDNSYDCIFALNAVHHFDLSMFLHQSARVLRSGGYLFIYTRLRDQNKRNIWGSFFPGFHQKETRLYTLNKMVKMINAVPGMWLQSVEYFKYRRLSSLLELEKKIRANHYSTFFLYPVDELEKAIIKFKKNIARAYEDIHRIYWHDENILFVIRKGEESVYSSE
jgi:ubiquinone/menaquinone biosynthesis C-methylase UbiE